MDDFTTASDTVGDHSQLVYDNGLTELEISPTEQVDSRIHQVVTENTDKLADLEHKLTQRFNKELQAISAEQDDKLKDIEARMTQQFKDHIERMNTEHRELEEEGSTRDALHETTVIELEEQIHQPNATNAQLTEDNVKLQQAVSVRDGRVDKTRTELSTLQKKHDNFIADYNHKKKQLEEAQKEYATRKSEWRQAMKEVSEASQKGIRHVQNELDSVTNKPAELRALFEEPQKAFATWCSLNLGTGQADDYTEFAKLVLDSSHYVPARPGSQIKDTIWEFLPGWYYDMSAPRPGCSDRVGDNLLVTWIVVKKGLWLERDHGCLASLAGLTERLAVDESLCAPILQQIVSDFLDGFREKYQYGTDMTSAAGFDKFDVMAYCMAMPQLVGVCQSRWPSLLSGTQSIDLLHRFVSYIHAPLADGLKHRTLPDEIEEDSSRLCKWYGTGLTSRCWFIRAIWDIGVVIDVDRSAIRVCSKRLIKETHLTRGPVHIGPSDGGMDISFRDDPPDADPYDDYIFWSLWSQWRTPPVAF